MLHSPLRRALAATSWMRVSAPIAIESLASRTYERSFSRPMSTRSVGLAKRSRISGRRECPPASSLASSPSPSSLIASSTDPATS